MGKGVKILLVIVFSLVLTSFAFDYSYSVKSQGTSLSETNSKKVCGDRLCSESNQEVKEESFEKDLELFDSTNPDKIPSDAELLFVQVGKSGSFIKTNDGYLLTIFDTSLQTIYFTDRPYRITGHMTTLDFVEGLWNHPSVDFNSNPPNAELVVFGNNMAKEIVIKLQNPKYNAQQNTIQYDVVVLNEFNEKLDETSANMDMLIPKKFAHASLFIDSVSDPMNNSKLDGKHTTHFKRAVSCDYDSLLKNQTPQPRASNDGLWMPNCDLSGANLKGADLRNANLKGVTLQGANLSGADLTGVDLSGVVNLTGVNLSGANLSGNDLSDLNLTLAILSSANLKGADFRDATLTGAILRDVTLTGVDLKGAELSGASMERADLRSVVNLSSAELSGAVMSSVNLSGANLKGMNLAGVNLSSANLKGADFRDANLAGASFFYANLKGADFRDATLTGASFQSADLTNADLKGAELSGANFESAVNGGCKGCP